jgi:HEAT repeat protein
MLQDADTDVRVSAISALANIRGSEVADIVRPYLDNPDGRLACSAAMVLARTGNKDEDLQAAQATLVRLAASQDAGLRREVAAAVRGDVDPQAHHVLIPLLYDNDPQVAEEALESVRKLGTTTFLFVPTLVALLRNRRLKGPARKVLVGYGSDVVPALAHFLRDPEEDAWVRRHIPGTLAQVASQASMDTLVAALGDNVDGFLRFKLLTAIDRLHGQHPEYNRSRVAAEIKGVSPNTTSRSSAPRTMALRAANTACAVPSRSR